MRIGRRGFLVSATAMGVCSALEPAWGLPAGDAAAVPQAQLAADPERPQFHLLPARNWMNDPNAPVYFNGQYHMFFQHNPHAPTWGDMSWGHAVSEDMLRWSHRPLALQPTPGGYDAYGCFSGSALVVRRQGTGRQDTAQRVYAVYTGTVKSSHQLATIKQDNVQETQCLAWSDDPGLITWTKAPRPVVPLPPPGLKVTGFRDPAVWQEGDAFYMTVGSGVERTGGCVLLYRSRDLRTWEYMHVLTSGSWSGSPTPNPCDDGEMWECPDLFPLGMLPSGRAHVLIYSTLGKVFWQSGVLHPATLKFTPLKSGLLDLGAYYAPKTQLDARGRRILWGWIQERRDDDAMRRAGWSGMMSLPRVLSLDGDGTLRIAVLPETSSLRAAALAPATTGNTTRLTVPQCTGEVECAGRAGSDFSMTVRAGSTEILGARYTAATHSFVVDGHTVALQENDSPTLHAFVDGSVLELNVGERIGCTRRFYPGARVAPEVEVVVSGRGVRLQGWRVTPISPDRLT